MTIIAIDPGPTESAMLLWENEKISCAAILPNSDMRFKVETLYITHAPFVLAVEMVASYGMAVGKDVFETVLQIGRLQELCQRLPVLCRLVYRLQVKQHLCHDSRAKDSNIRQALVDRFGVPGSKNHPGPLYGIRSHLWSALAVAVYAADNPVDPPESE